MTTTDFSHVQEWRGSTVLDRSGQKIGKLDEIYLDQETGRPEWALVNTGLFGTSSSFVPLNGAEPAGDDVRVNWDKEHVNEAPKVDVDRELSHEEESQLYQHYGFDYANGQGDTSAGDTSAGDTSGPNTDNAMTRSEEELQVGKTDQERGRVRLKKYVVTEQEQHTIPVQREVARVEREPITDANADQALDGPEISDEEHEMTLREERPVVEKQVVPKERVRLGKDVETDEHNVSEDVRKERIETEGDVGR